MFQGIRKVERQKKAVNSFMTLEESFLFFFLIGHFAKSAVGTFVYNEVKNGNIL